MTQIDSENLDINSFLRRNEVTAREGIDTPIQITTGKNAAVGRNEVTAREGIDTSPFDKVRVTRTLGRRNEVTAREGIDTIYIFSRTRFDICGRNEVTAR